MDRNFKVTFFHLSLGRPYPTLIFFAIFLIVFTVSEGVDQIVVRCLDENDPLINCSGLRLSAPIFCSAWSDFNLALTTGYRHPNYPRESGIRSHRCRGYPAFLFGL